MTLWCDHVTSCDAAVRHVAEQNGTTLRSLFYPPVKQEQVKEGQLRCGEHSDYGSITLLFQSSEGLQVGLPSPLCGPR